MAATQYNATGKVFDLTKLITNISPSDTPVLSLIGTADAATQVVHNWEEDTLSAPVDNAQVEGFSYSVDDPGETTIKDNVCQIFKKGFGVTDTNLAIKRYNMKNKLAYEMQKAMKLIALDEERAIIQNSTKVLGNSGTARKMAGLPYFITTNVKSNSGTSRDLTYELLNNALEDVYKAGGEPDVIVASPRNKRILSMLLPLSTNRSQKADSKKIVATIDVFEGDFGIQRVVTDRWIPDTDVYVLSSEYFGMSYLRPFKRETLPKTKDATEELIKGEVTLEARAEKASARITDLNGTLPDNT